MVKHNTNAAVRSVLTACRRDDPDAKLANYTVSSEGKTLIRLRPGAATSADALWQSILAHMPLAATVACTTSQLDGSVETTIAVPTRSDERRAARRMATRGLCANVLLLSGGLLLGTGLCMLLAAR